MVGGMYRINIFLFLLRHYKSGMSLFIKGIVHPKMKILCSIHK